MIFGADSRKFTPSKVSGYTVYNEAIQSVITVRDFTQIFDAYSQYEETMIQSKMESTTELTEEGTVHHSDVM